MDSHPAHHLFALKFLLFLLPRKFSFCITFSFESTCDRRKNRWQTKAGTVSTLCCCSQTHGPWYGRNSHAVLQNLKPFLRLSAMTSVNWIIKLQMRRSHFTVLRNPCTQLTLMVVSQERLTVLSFNSLRPSKEVGIQESHCYTDLPSHRRPAKLEFTRARTRFWRCI